MPEFKNEDHKEHYLGRRAKALKVLNTSNGGLENLPDMKTAKLETIPHQWDYYAFGGKFERICTNLGCDKSETIRTRLTEEQVGHYRFKIQNEPQLFERKSGNCTNYSKGKK